MKKMMPIGPLMIEHRLIERMLVVMEKELNRIEKEKILSHEFISKIVDFIRFYADRCHHGKEEDILFRELKKKSLSSEHKKILDELIEEHKFGRKTTKTMADANTKYIKGDEKSLDTIVECMKKLVNFYPKHIEKEDQHFFLPVMKYFTEEEKEKMLEEGYTFDQNLVHEKYKGMVLEFEELQK